MRRRHALGLLAGAVAAPGALHAQPLRYGLEPTQVAAGIWMVEGAPEYFGRRNGGHIVNVTLLQGASGLVLVDTGPSLRFGEELSALARSLDPRGVSEVLVTHHHPDHWFGNQAFANVPIRALGETRLGAIENGDGYADALYRLVGDWMRGTEPLPPTAVIQPGEIAVAGRPIRALGLSGHTAGDLALMDVETGTLIAGDLVFNDRAPTTPDARITDWLVSLDALGGLGAARIVPGHGPVDPAGASVAQTRDYLTWLDARLRDAAARGRSMVEVMEEPIPPRFDEMGALPEEYHRSVSHLYADIERELLPLAD